MATLTNKKKPATKLKAPTPGKTILSVTDFLNEAPMAADVQEHDGAFHIPILNLENSLDFFRWGTRNFVWQLYKNGYAKLGVGASLELLLSYTDENGEKVVDRPFVGACNFLIESVPFEDWLATAKSLCIKNAAAHAGKKLGRGLNADVMPKRQKNPLAEGISGTPLREPDSIMQEEIRAAMERDDKGALELYSKIYVIN